MPSPVTPSRRVRAALRPRSAPHSPPGERKRHEPHPLRSARWAEAFADVPRHVFVPRWYERETDERGVTVWQAQHTIAPSELANIYRDVTLVTALDPATAERVDTGAWTGVPTSSSTQPSLMAGMLEDLHVQDGQRVLEHRLQRRAALRPPRRSPRALRRHRP